MIDFFKDFIKFISFKLRKSKNELCFFCENRFILNYLEPFISKKSKNKPVLIFCFENIDYKEFKNVNFFFLKTNFFRELFFLTANFKYLYSSTPDLENTIFKRTKFSKCKYIYLHHSPVSLTLIYNSNAFDAFDAVQAISTYQFKEMKEIISKNKLRTRVFKSKYLFINKQIEKNKTQNPDADVLIAPSWNTSFYKLGCHKLLIKNLTESKISYKLRPHPMSLVKKETSINDLEKLGIPIDKLNFLNLYKYRFLITDWSGIFIEFALIFKRKSFLVNTPKKIHNQSYLNYSNKPSEISLRNILAKTYDIKNIQNIVKEIKVSKNEMKEDENLKKIINENFY